jgi:hypothetical protein
VNQKQREETLIDNFASLALENMAPTEHDIELGRAYIDGRMTPEAIVEDAKKRYHG